MLKQVIAMRTDLNMRKGKMAAQATHVEKVMFLQRMNTSRELAGRVAMVIDLSLDEYAWLQTTHTTIVVGVSSEEELHSLMEKAVEMSIKIAPVEDLGTTEFHGRKTLTCCGFGPDQESVLDPLTRGLKLL
jgi:PTH2 family peptidyl-tRNA hydrolase